MSVEKYEGIKRKAEENPEFKRRLEVDFVGTLKEEGVEVEKLRERALGRWSAEVCKRLTRRMDETSHARKGYRKRIAEGKSLKLRVEIDPETGERRILLRDDE